MSTSQVLGNAGTAFLLSREVDIETVLELLVVCGCIGVGGLVLLYIFCPEPTLPGPIEKPTFTFTLKVFLSTNMLLMMPLFWAVSVNQGFFSSSFPLYLHNYYTSDGSNLALKLYILAVLSLVDAGASVGIGRLFDLISPVWILLAGLIWQTATLATLSAAPAVNNLGLLFGVACCIGVSDAVCRTCLRPRVPFLLLQNVLTYWRMLAAGYSSIFSGRETIFQSLKNVSRLRLSQIPRIITRRPSLCCFT